jgi:hypothetical protein
MLGRKDYTPAELDRARTAINSQLTAYRDLVEAADATKDQKVSSALAAFDPLFFDNMTLVLDRYFVHRLRAVTGKDGNPLNEVEMICDSLISNDGVMLASDVINLIPDQSIVQLQVGDPIELNLADFERLSGAFFADLERKFLQG